MGTYADWKDVIDRYSKLSSAADSIEMGDGYITGAEAFINAMLSGPYTVPVSDNPPLLKDICVDLVFAKMMIGKDKSVKEVRTQALQMLKDLASGTMDLIDENGSAVSTVGQAIWSTSEDYHSTFSELGPDGDLIDPELLEDLYDER